MKFNIFIFVLLFKKLISLNLNLSKTINKNIVYYELENNDINLYQQLLDYEQSFYNLNLDYLYLKIDTKLGQDLVIKCPSLTKNLTDIYWFKIPIHISSKIMYLNQNHRIYTDKNYLVIKNFHSSDSGIYFCLTANSFSASKDPSLFSNPSILQNHLNLYPIFRIEIFIFDYQTNQRVALVTKEPILIEYDLYMFYENDMYDKYSGLFFYIEWSSWSECTGGCKSEINLRSRRGFCRVRYKTNESSNPFLYKIQTGFKINSWSCYSNIHYSFLSAEFLKIYEFIDFIEYASCKLACDDFDQYLIDKEIKNLNNYNSESNFESLNKFEINQTLFKNVLKNKIERFVGENVVLVCIDYTLDMDGDIKWNFNRDWILDKVNYLNELVIEDLKLNDSGVYDCYFNNKLVLSIILKVEPKYEFNKDKKHNYNVYKRVLFITISVFSIFILVLIFIEIGNELNVNNKNSQLEKKYLNLDNYLKLNIDYFEREILNELTRLEFDFDQVPLTNKESNSSQCTFELGLIS